MQKLLLAHLCGVLLLVLLVCAPAPGHAAAAGGASPQFDVPMVHSPVTVAPQEKSEPSTPMKVLQAVSWYIPNRLADIFDVPKVYLSLGSGLGGTFRATKALYFSYMDTETYCIGWGGRKMDAGGSIFFHERIDEQYMGFLAAQQGNMQRDASELGLSLHLWAIGANIAFSGAELLDAVTGIVGIDLMDDDHGPVFFDKTEKKQAPAVPPPSAVSAPPTASPLIPAQAAQPAGAVTPATSAPQPVNPNWR
ncbi:hypothetical protein LLG95_04770 [bacterium]|nr:hypothetical protein [bacterium]